MHFAVEQWRCPNDNASASHAGDGAPASDPRSPVGDRVSGGRLPGVRRRRRLRPARASSCTRPRLAFAHPVTGRARSTLRLAAAGGPRAALEERAIGRPRGPPYRPGRRTVPPEVGEGRAGPLEGSNAGASQNLPYRKLTSADIQSPTPGGGIDATRATGPARRTAPGPRAPRSPGLQHQTDTREHHRGSGRNPASCSKRVFTSGIKPGAGTRR